MGLRAGTSVLLWPLVAGDIVCHIKVKDIARTVRQIQFVVHRIHGHACYSASVYSGVVTEVGEQRAVHGKELQRGISGRILAFVAEHTEPIALLYNEERVVADGVVRGGVGSRRCCIPRVVRADVVDDYRVDRRDVIGVVLQLGEQFAEGTACRSPE